jgi:uncharacterized coiled-coil DUF342 family protein
MVESMMTMPRVLSEIDEIEGVLKKIHTEMTSLSEQLSAFDENNINGVEDLSRLDALKSNMEDCKATLEEHARWSQLVRESKYLMEECDNLSESAARFGLISFNV